jgi:hypothetical protein
VLIPRKESNAMKKFNTTASTLPPEILRPVGKAWGEVSASFDRFCLAAGIEALGTMLEKDAEEACGPRHSRGEGRRGYRWGRTQGKIGFHGGKVAIERPRVRELDGKEVVLASWEQSVAEDWLGRWALNLTTSRRGGLGGRCGFPRATFRLREAPACRSQRRRAISWRCLPSV